MKKSLIGIWVCSSILMLACVAIVSYKPRTIESCGKLASISATSDFEAAGKSKSFALRFPVH